MRVQPDVWLGEVLERPVYRVAFGDSEPPDGANPFAGKEDAEAFYFAKIAANRVDQVRALERAGFFVVDVNVTLDREPARDDAPLPVLVRDSRLEDMDPVLEIAASCFVYSRFHLDPLMPNELADRIKREWIRNYLLGNRGERLLVAEHEGRPAGFLAVLAADIHGHSYRVIDLIGVAKEAQGHGIGRSLSRHFISRYAGQCERLRVGTQVANIPATRLYEQCGFRLAESSYVLHAHVKGGRVVS
ncbi:MAG: GNAT family N-acetyltransferase [Armatimonadetes bacterium]|nr:GNAT family N-acetyltransferase [Armatimonadota bacterium]